MTGSLKKKIDSRNRDAKRVDEQIRKPDVEREQAEEENDTETDPPRAATGRQMTT